MLEAAVDRRGWDMPQSDRRCIVGAADMIEDMAGDRTAGDTPRQPMSVLVDSTQAVWRRPSVSAEFAKIGYVQHNSRNNTKRGLRIRQ